MQNEKEVVAVVPIRNDWEANLQVIKARALCARARRQPAAQLECGWDCTPPLSYSDSYIKQLLVPEDKLPLDQYDRPLPAGFRVSELRVGRNTIKIHVVAVDPSVAITYTLNVERRRKSTRDSHGT